MIADVAAPAKVNLSLRLTGRRADGFHELVSVVAPLALADALGFEPGGDADRLVCDDPSLPVDASNLVLRAAAAFRAAVPAAPHGRFRLRKRVPHGAGLGGGSSDAAAALRLLNAAAGSPLAAEALRSLAAQVGSDCPLFVDPRAAVIRGRGERLAPLAMPAWRGRRILLAKPSFGVATADAYRWFAAEGRLTDPAAAEAELAAALATGDPAAVVALGNDLEAPVFARLPALAAGVAAARAMGAALRLTGSGSACFALVGNEPDLGALRAALRPAWGDDVFLIVTDLA